MTSIVLTHKHTVGTSPILLIEGRCVKNWAFKEKIKDSTNSNTRYILYPFLHRGRPSGGKVRHKRQALQDMARPLKQWLYKHRDNPYPTKTEKILLALGSQMTLVQVRPLSGNPSNFQVR